MGSRVVDADLVAFLTGFIRDELALLSEPVATGVFVSNKFPESMRSRAVVVRDDGGPSTSIITTAQTVGITVLAGDDWTQRQEASRLASLVKMIVKDSARLAPGNPIAAVLSSFGPYDVTEESGQPAQYFTVQFSVVGTPYG